MPEVKFFFVNYFFISVEQSTGHVQVKIPVLALKHFFFEIENMFTFGVYSF